jgi:hypothetical protein
MAKRETELLVKTAGAFVHVITRSSPAAMVLFFYSVFSLFCLWLGNSTYWMVSSAVVVAVLILLWLFKPERLWTEKHSIEMKKLDLKHLGDKKNPQVKKGEYNQLYQPQMITGKRSVNVEEKK